MEATLEPKNLLIDNSPSDGRLCKWKAVQVKNNKGTASNCILTKTHPYQNVADEVNELHDNNSMNSNFSKHCRNVSFNTAQKVHYYEAEKTNKRSKAGLWLQLQDENVGDNREIPEVDTSSDSSSSYEGEYIVTESE